MILQNQFSVIFLQKYFLLRYKNKREKEYMCWATKEIITLKKLEQDLIEKEMNYWLCHKNKGIKIQLFPAVEKF